MFGTILALIFATLLLVLRLCIYLKAKKKRRKVRNAPPAVQARRHAYLTAAKRIRTVELEGKGGRVWMDLCYDEVDEGTLDLDDLTYRVRAEIGREGKMVHYKDFWCLTLDQVEVFLDALKSLYESGDGEVSWSIPLRIISLSRPIRPRESPLNFTNPRKRKRICSRPTGSFWPDSSGNWRR